MDISSVFCESELNSREICQLVSGTKDGFPEIEEQIHYDSAGSTKLARN